VYFWRLDIPVTGTFIIFINEVKNMLQIGELSTRTGVSSKTIRYYEEIGLLPPAKRADNDYRIYDEEDIERLGFIRRARSLDFALEDIDEILAFRDRDEPPCKYVMDLMRSQIDEVSARIRDLEKLRTELTNLHEAGMQLPEDVQMRSCVCHLIGTGVTKQEDGRAKNE
jgi:DNA-binding transcriptional MerR regulator